MKITWLNNQLAVCT